MGLFKKIRRGIRKTTRKVGRTVTKSTRGIRREIRKAGRAAARTTKRVVPRAVRRQAQQLARRSAASLRTLERTVGKVPALRRASALAHTASAIAQGKRIDRALASGIKGALPAYARMAVTAGEGVLRGRRVDRAVTGAIRNETQLLRDELQAALSSRVPRPLGGVPVGRQGVAALHTISKTARGLRHPGTVRQATQSLKNMATGSHALNRLARAAMSGVRLR
jgi:hypothetical protein